MRELNESVRALLASQLWTIATHDGVTSNAVPMAFKTITPDGRLAIASVFMETTVKNVEKNGEAAISVFDPATMEGYQIKGAAAYITEGPVVDQFKAVVEEKLGPMGRKHGVELTANGVVLVTPERVIVTAPGPSNKQEL